MNPGGVVVAADPLGPGLWSIRDFGAQVIVSEDEILSRGFTGAPGARHAEASSIASLSYTGSASTLSAFVTLEPCAFQGRTPSCARAMIDRGIGSVFVGIIDPDPRNNGRGIRLLMDAGIRVELGILEQEIREFLAPYLVGARTD